MKALDLKLLRDLQRMWSQSLTIALVVASGVAGFVTSLSAVDSLDVARSSFYDTARFADVFADLVRAPDGLSERLRAIPGVAQAQTSVERVVRIDLPGKTDPLVGRLIGLEPGVEQRLNRVIVRSGRALDPQLAAAPASSAATLQALVTEGFAQAHGLQPGARVGALIDGRRRTLLIVGIAVSPEYVFAGMTGMPDPKGFGVFWIDRESLAAACDMQGAFNHVAIRLAPGGRPEAVIDALARLLAPWGGRPPTDRSNQLSHAMLDNEIREQRVLGTVLPTIFAGVAIFLLNVVMSRMVATQREQIAALKALGYRNRAIAVHYLKLVAIISATGLILGLSAGYQLGQRFTQLYADFFHFPVFDYRLAPWLIATSVAVTAATAFTGTLGAIRATARLAPAEAMRPPAPGHYHRNHLERLGLSAASPALRMILRNMQRRALRTTMSVTGVAVAIAIVVMGNFVRDAIDTIVDSAFGLALRGDVIVWLTNPADDGMRHDMARLPGVLAVESGRDVPVRFRNGHLTERGAIQGYAESAQLRRVFDVDGRQAHVPADGLMMTDRLAAKLGLRAGDLVGIEVLEGRLPQRQIILSATVSDMMGLNAFMQRDSLNRLVGEGDLSSHYTLSLERGAEAHLLDVSRALPKVAGAFSKATLQQNMQEISARNIRIMSTAMTAFASVIAIGVVYNTARIALAERTWELASLRVLGFTRAEVSALLLGELAIGIALSLPLGMALGWALVHLVAGLLKSDQFLFPVTIQPRTYAWAALCVLTAAAGSAAVVRRRIDRLDMVAALKTRE